MNIVSFRAALAAWFTAGHRDLPWRRTCDPYRIWVSEIMLQQTRAAAAIPYYERFLALFPTAAALALASESEVLAAWSGLGYYHRARNLRKSAQRIAAAQKFPDTYAAIRGLDGVGDYTAAAVASIAFGLPHAVLDGNVLRVIGRIQADTGEIGAGVTMRRFQAIADSWLDVQNPGAFNQAMMELGATVCLPRNPQCLLCPVSAFCQAHAAGTEEQYPVKRSKPITLTDKVDLLLAERNAAVLVRQRPADSSRMAAFWELPEVATVPGARATSEIGSFQHTIVNTRWTIHVFRCAWRGNARLPEGVLWKTRPELLELPLTTITKKALRLGSVRA